jgi:hypothetical protein
MLRAMSARLAVVLAIITTIVACKDNLPAPPDPQRYSTLNEDERCEAAAPRAILCVDHLLVAQFRQLSDGLPEELVKEVTGGERTSTTDARLLHRTSCLGDERYADAVVTCWSVADCAAFADCVVGQSSRTPKLWPQLRDRR